MKRLLGIVLAAAVTANCAAGAYTSRPELSPDHFTFSRTKQDPPAMTAAYLKGLPVGSKVSIRLTDGKTMKVTLMAVQEEAVVVRPRTRLPEPAQTIPFERILTAEVDRENGVGRAVAIGAAVGAGAAIGVLFVLAALIAD